MIKLIWTFCREYAKRRKYGRNQIDAVGLAFFNVWIASGKKMNGFSYLWFILYSHTRQYETDNKMRVLQKRIDDAKAKVR